MKQSRPLARVASWYLVFGVALAALAPLSVHRIASGPWESMHAAVVLLGSVLPALYALHIHVLHQRTGHMVSAKRYEALLGVAAAAPVLAALTLAFAETWTWIAWLAATSGSVLMMLATKDLAPNGTMEADVESDPLTKGDAASMKHISFAHRFLPLGLLMMAVATMPFMDTMWAGRLWLAGFHVGIMMYVLLSLYGLGHILIPRFSGIPAIAAGAIKGELHSTLLGITGMTVGFLLGHSEGVGRGLVVGLGPFVFLGMFTYMGVLGANIMKNKSKTQRVTPEFSYIPWTFAGVFWLIAGVMMGILLNAVPDVLLDRFNGLRFMHIHAALAGGLIMFLIGWMHRLEASDSTGPDGTEAVDLRRIVPFHVTRMPFLLLNGALMWAMGAMLAESWDSLAIATIVVAATIAWVLVAVRKWA